MAFFRKDKPANDDADAVNEPVIDESDGDASEPTSEPAAEEAVPHVGISVSTFGKPAARPEPKASAQKELPENSPLRHALAALPEKPEPRDIMNVMRQALQGHLYLRVNGNAQEILARGEQVTLAVSTVGENRFLLAFTGPAALEKSIVADGNMETSAIGQPAHAVLQNVVSGPYQGLVIDHASENTRLILPRQLIEKALTEGESTAKVKELLSAPRTAATPAEVGALLAETGGWVAVRGEGEGAGITEVRTNSGVRRIEIFSHPLEVIALGREDRPGRITAQGLGRALASDEGITGIVVNPAGPWIEIDRGDLAPVVAAVDAAPETVDPGAEQD